MSKVDDISAQLPSLTDDELRVLQDKIKFLQSTAGGTTLAPDDDDEWLVLTAICHVLKRLGVEFAEPSILHRASTPAFRAKIKGLIAYLESMQHNERYALLCFGVELLYRDMTRLGVPISGMTLMRHIHRLPAVINAAFPGYAQAGMLHWIVRAHQARNKLRADAAPRRLTRSTTAA